MAIWLLLVLLIDKPQRTHAETSCKAEVTASSFCFFTNNMDFGTFFKTLGSERVEMDLAKE
jgi:hypothetical protein